MEEFGFKISESTRIDLDTAGVSNFFDKVAAKVPEIRTCINCGSCSASCSSAPFRRTSFRSTILQIKRGTGKEAVKLLESCMLCGKCLLVCPRGINTRDIILNILREKEELL